MRRNWNPPIDDPVLIDLVTRLKRTDGEAADEMGFDIITVGAHRKRLNLVRNLRHKMPHQSFGPEPPPPKDRPNPVAVARVYLDARLVEKSTGYWLDGRPAGLDAIMQACNIVRVGLGMEQILGSERWRV